MVSVHAQEWLGEEPSHFLAASVGVGTGDILTAYLVGVLPGVDVRIVQAIAGALIVKYGSKAHVLVKSYGRGVLYQLVGNVVRGAATGSFQAFTAGPTGSTGAVSNVFGGA